MNGLAKFLGVAVVALGVGVGYAPEAFARGVDTWEVKRSHLTNAVNDSEWDAPNSFSMTWDYYSNDYNQLTFLKIRGFPSHDERGGDFVANWWYSDYYSILDVSITNFFLEYTIVLMDWDPYGDKRQYVTFKVDEKPTGIQGVFFAQVERKASTPEPSSLLGLTLLGAIGSTLARKKQKPTELS